MGPQADLIKLRSLVTQLQTQLLAQEQPQKEKRKAPEAVEAKKPTIAALALPAPPETETEQIAEDTAWEEEAEAENVLDGQTAAAIARKLAKQHSAQCINAEPDEAEEEPEPNEPEEPPAPIRTPAPACLDASIEEAMSSAAAAPATAINSSTHKKEYMRLVLGLKWLPKYRALYSNLFLTKKRLMDGGALEAYPSMHAMANGTTKDACLDVSKPRS